MSSSFRPSRHPLARVLAALGVAALVGACGLIPKKVTKKDCEKWSDHFNTKMGAFIEKQEGCDDKAAAKTMKGSLSTSLDAIGEACTAYVDTLPYLSKDETCFLGGGSTKDWKKCDFGTTTAFYMFNATAEGLEKSSEAICASNKGSKKSADDDDGDAPKKKPAKKKKAADDE